MNTEKNDKPHESWWSVLFEKGGEEDMPISNAVMWISIFFMLIYIALGSPIQNSPDTTQAEMVGKP